MRKITTAITAILLAAMMTAGISAYDAETDEKQADALNEMGLFKGTDNGYDLENVPTRAQSSVMLVRFLGKEEEAMGLEYTAPFNDVADWAKPYIQYLWQNGLANGYGDGRYGADDPCTAQMYATIVLRVLGYSDKDAKDFTYDKAIEFATEKGLDCPAEGFLRGDMVGMTYSALAMETADGKNKKLVEKLADDGVLTDKQEKIINGEEGHTYEFYPDGKLKKDTYKNGYKIYGEDGLLDESENTTYYDNGSIWSWYKRYDRLTWESKSFDEDGRVRAWFYVEDFPIDEFDYTYSKSHAQTPRTNTSFYGNGVIKYKDTFNKYGQRIETLRYNENGSFMDHCYREFDGAKLAKQTNVSEKGEIWSYYVYEYDGNLTTWYTYNSKDELLGYNKDYYDDQDRWTVREGYDADGFMTTHIDYYYDENGKCTTNITEYERN